MANVKSSLVTASYILCMIVLCNQLGTLSYTNSWYPQTEPEVQVSKSNTHQEADSGLTIYEERTKTIKHICNQLKDDTHAEIKGLKIDQNVQSNFYVKERETNTLLCLNFKVGISSWLRLFYDVNQNKEKLDKILKGGFLYKLIPHLSPGKRQIKKDSSDSNVFKFLAVRNPFDRVLSAYANRFVEHKSGQYATHIRKMKKHDEGGNFYKKGEIPTFSDFLHYIVDGGADVHWKTYWSACSPCVVDYTAVIKLEDGQPAIDYILQKSGMIKYASMPPAKNTSSKRMDEYKKVSCELLRKVYKIYQLDFILFDFSPSAYLQNIDVYCDFEDVQ